MSDYYKEVRFDIYCSKCEHKKKEDFEDPCNECLAMFAREGTIKPVNYKEKEGK